MSDPTRSDLQELLRGIPLATQGDEEAAQQTLSLFIQLRNAAAAGAGHNIPGMAIAGGIPALIGKLKAGDVGGVAVDLVSIAGDVAGAYSFLVTAGIEMGAITGASAASSSAVVAGMIGEAAGPFAIAVAVVVGVLSIPSDTSANNGKMFFAADASGILTSWMFNLPHLNPHQRLLRESRTAGYMHTDISRYCVQAHDAAHRLWQRNYRGNVAARQAARRLAGDDWGRFWTMFGESLSLRLRTFPTMAGNSMVRRVIRESRQRSAQAERDLRNRQAVQRQRRANGGVWFRGADGQELFLPDR